MFYHVIIKPKSDKYYGEYKTDLTKEQLISRFVEPYEQGMPIVINGKTVQPDDLERIKISKSEKTIESLIPQIKAEDRASSVAFIGGPSYTHQAIGRATDVTDDFIEGLEEQIKNLKDRVKKTKQRKVDLLKEKEDLLVEFNVDHKNIEKRLSQSYPEFT